MFQKWAALRWMCKCQYEESNRAWWFERTAITCPKNLRLPIFMICIARPWSDLGGLRNWTNFVEPIQSYELLKSRWCDKIKPNQAWCKNRKFQKKFFVLFLIFHNCIISLGLWQFQRAQNDICSLSVNWVILSCWILEGAEFQPFWKKNGLKAKF